MKQSSNLNNETQRRTTLKAILITGLIAGFLDGAAAAIVYVITTGGNPIKVFLFISSSVLGKDAFQGGIPVAILGLLFHFTIAISFAAFYFFLYPRMKVLSNQKVAAGLLYGIFVWIVMNVLVLPQTLVPQFPFDFFQAARGVVILMLMIGLPISFMTHRHFAQQNS
jgi:hypothetical protein